MHHLNGVALHLVFDITVEGYEGVGVGAFLHGLQPLVVDLHALLQFALGLGGLFTAEVDGLAIGRQTVEHQFLIGLLLLLVEGPHIVETGVVGQFAVDVVIGLIVSAEGALLQVVADLDGVEDVEGFVVEADVGAANGEQRAAAYLVGGVAGFFGQADALAEEVDGGVADEGAIEFVEAQALVVLLLATGGLEGAAGGSDLGFALGYVLRRLGDGLVDLAVSGFHISTLCPKCQ